MKDPAGPRDAAIERRLERLSMAEAPASARHRVLMAVDDVLAERAPALDRAALAEAPDWKWAAAVAIGIALVVPLVASWLPVPPDAPATSSRTVVRRLDIDRLLAEIL